jgi:hypothetical protein
MVLKSSRAPNTGQNEIDFYLFIFIYFILFICAWFLFFSTSVIYNKMSSFTEHDDKDNRLIFE